MKLSTKATYGLRAMCDLALKFGQGPVSVMSIAEREGLSVTYLEQLLNRLRRHHLVQSIRGPKGGYVLASDPRNITVGEIVRILEGSLDIVSNPDGFETVGSDKKGMRVAEIIWRRLSETIAEVLDTTNLADLCDEAQTLGLLEEIEASLTLLA